MNNISEFSSLIANTPPFISDPTVYNETDSVTLICRHDGNPSPIAIRWMRDNNVTASPVLTINSIQQSDAGDYTCCLDRVIAGDVETICDGFTIAVQCEYSCSLYVCACVCACRCTFDLQFSDSCWLTCSIHIASVHWFI